MLLQLRSRSTPRVPKLSSTQLSHVDDVLFSSRCPATVIDDVTRADLWTLRDGEWLNDQVINAYMSLLTRRASSPDSAPDKRPRLFLFNTFFFSKLQSDGYASVRRWSKKTDLFAMDLVLVPVHLGTHWCMAAIDFSRKTIEYYDSLGGSGANAIRVLRRYLHEEHRDKKKEAFDDSGWTDVDGGRAVPQQKNGYDCGVFACMFAETLAGGAKKFAFEQKDMKDLRRRMAYEIAKGKLIV